VETEVGGYSNSDYPNSDYSNSDYSNPNSADQGYSGLERIDLLGLPLDIVTGDGLSEWTMSALAAKEAGARNNIVILSFLDILRARSEGEYRGYVLNAGLALPLSKSLVKSAKFLKGAVLTRYMPFDFVVSLLSILEAKNSTVYLLGAQKSVLIKTERNIRQTFPQLRIVGRHPGKIKKGSEETLLIAIKKCSPDLILVGRGIRGRERWLAKNSQNLPPGLRLWCSDIFEIFAERKKRPSRSSFENGFEWLGYFFVNPIRIFRIFLYIYYKLLVLVAKIKQEIDKIRATRREKLEQSTI
jgi:N-acetylglucosaminyldiphosphoundecaprenol N-acetyl-beta-D-mannosaminyltransferase